MCESMQPNCVDGYTLLNIQLCKERIRRKFALELALEAARVRNAEIYQTVFSQQPFPGKPVRLGLFELHKSAVSLQRSIPRQRPIVQQESALKSDLPPTLEVRFKGPSRSKSDSRVYCSRRLREVLSALLCSVQAGETCAQSPKTERSKTEFDTSQRSVCRKSSLRSVRISVSKSQQSVVPKAQKSKIKVSDVVSKAQKRAASGRSKTQKSITEIFSKDQKNKSNKKIQEKQQNQKCRCRNQSPQESKAKGLQQKPPKNQALRSKASSKSLKKRYSDSEFDSQSESESVESMSRKDKCMEACQSRQILCEKIQKRARCRSSDRSSMDEGTERRSSQGSKGQKGKSADGSSSRAKGCKNRNNQQQSQGYLCTCSTCGNQTTCCCVEDLEAINEECDNTDLDDGSTSNQCCDQCKPCAKCISEEEDACGEFFDVMRDSMEDAVKKSLEDVFGRYFSRCMHKLDSLACQVECTQNILSKMYTDLNDKISYYGERNAQQFQYLCVRMEHDRLFYQQQQEYFLKQNTKKASDASDADDGELQDSETVNVKVPVMKCRVQSVTGKCELACGNDDKHVKGRHWECTLTEDDQTDPEGGLETTNDTDEDEGKKVRRSKSKSKNEVPEKLARKKSETLSAESGKRRNSNKK